MRAHACAHPELRALTTLAGPQPEDVAFAIETDPDRCVDRPLATCPSRTFTITPSMKIAA
jgi:plasmid maintenance system killer protein